MSESSLLAHIYQRSRGLVAPGAHILVGPGDDCAVIEVGDEPGASVLLLKVDQVVESRHFESSTPLDLIARKAIARAVSDVAAMGGSPTVALCAAVLPANYLHADQLFDAAAKWAIHFGCPLVGGDIATLAAPGPLVLSITILAKPHASRGPVLRSAARVGDHVFVTGHLGNSLASGRHLTFEPRLREASWLCDVLGQRLHAMMDLSDGLGRDAGRLALASGVRLEIDASSIPRNIDCPTWQRAVADGEDYELLFTAAGDVPAHCQATGAPITRIGTVVAGTGAVATASRGVVDISTMGWDHAT